MDALESNTPLCWQGVFIAQNIRFSALEIGVIDGLRDLEVQRKGNKTSDQAQQKNPQIATLTLASARATHLDDALV